MKIRINVEKIVKSISLTFSSSSELCFKVLPLIFYVTFQEIDIFRDFDLVIYFILKERKNILLIIFTKFII